MCFFKLNKDHDYEELNLNEIRKMLEKVKHRRPTIFIGGGEPFLREDILEIIELIHFYKLKCGMVTNGTLLSDEKIEKLMRLQIDSLIFSLHGPALVHDSITQNKGGFERLIDTIEVTSKNKKKTKLILNCVINPDNYLFIEEVVEIAQKVNVDLVRFEHLVFMTKSELKKNDEIINKKFPHLNFRFSTHKYELENRIDTEKFTHLIRKVKKKYGSFVIFKPLLNDVELKKWYSSDLCSFRRCFFLWHSIFVLPNGNVIPCQFLQDYILGNLLVDDLEAIWQGDRLNKLRQIIRKQPLPGCSRCCKL